MYVCSVGFITSTPVYVNICYVIHTYAHTYAHLQWLYCPFAPKGLLDFTHVCKYLFDLLAFFN